MRGTARKLLRRVLSAALALALLLVLPGCGEESAPRAEWTVPPLPSYAPPEEYPAYTGRWEDTDEPLTIYVEYFPLCSNRTQERFREFLESYLDKSINLKWIALPDTPGAAEKLLTQLRIEIAAGGGPDVFLTTCPVSTWHSDNGSSPLDAISLFPNPEKSMRTDVFLPLDGLLENPSFMEPELMNQTVFSAGRTSEGQMVLPISYTYDVAAIAEGVLPEGTQAPANRAELLAVENDVSILAMNYLYYRGSGAPSRMLGPLADYDREELLFTEEELLEWAMEYNNVFRTVWEMHLYDDATAVHAGAVHRMEDSNTRWRGKGQADSLIFPLYNIYGGLTAEVTAFAAINKNTKQANNSMYLLDLLFRPEVLQNEGVQLEGGAKVYLRYLLNTPIMSGGISILDGFYLESCNKQDMVRLMELEEQHVNTVRFCSQIDETLLKMFDELKGREPKTEEEIADLVSATYAKLQMILQE